MDGTLLEQYAQQLSQEGYVVLPNFVDSATIDSLLTETKKLVDEFDPKDTRNVFSTTGVKNYNEYFLNSADKIRYFLEEHAMNEKGEFIVPRDKSLNKIGHALHVLNPVFHEFSSQERIKQIAKNVMKLQTPQIMQSMIIFKQPRIGGYVDAHQDSSFLFTDPLSCNAFWFALEDVTKENGCLWVLPKSHHRSIECRFLRAKDDTLSFHPKKSEASDYDLTQFIPLECSKGSLVILHGSVVHLSYANTSTQSRIVYTFHVVDGSAKYAPENWLQLDSPFRLE